MRTKKLALASVTVLLLSGIVACGSDSGGESGDGPIRIGLSTYLSGSFASLGVPMEKASKVWAKMTNDDGGILGRDVKVEVKDDAGEQTKAIQNLREFASDGIPFYIANGTSSICTALAPVAEQLHSMIVSGCADPSLLPTNGGPDSHYMADLSQDAFALAAGSLAKEKFPDITTWDIYTMDYLTGHTIAKKVKTQIESQNPQAKVDSQVFTPLGASDQRAYINALNSDAKPGKRGLYVYTIGSLGPNFMKQASPVGLFSKYDAIVYQQLNDQILDTVGADFPEMWGIADYIPDSYADVPAGKEFADTWTAMYPKDPVPWAFFAVTNPLDGLKAAMEKAKSADYDKVKAAMDDGLTYEGLKGEVTIKDHYWVTTMGLVHCVGDAAEERGWKCDQGEAIPVDAVTPKEFLP
jgi:branched-chain amino acid transport system substrate-binding protein